MFDGRYPLQALFLPMTNWISPNRVRSLGVLGVRGISFGFGTGKLASEYHPVSVRN